MSDKEKILAFEPSFWGLLLNPAYFARQGLFQNIHFFAHQIHGKTLDVGCGTKPYRHLFYVEEYIGLEVERTEEKSPFVDVYYNGEKLPFDSDVFDSVVTFQVLEHVANPKSFLSEIIRVLKPGGVLLLSAPFIFIEHEKPYDFFRFSSFGVHSLLEEVGFHEIVQKKSVNDIRVAFQLLILVILNGIKTKNMILKRFLLILIVLPLNILGSILSWVTPKTPDCFLDNVALAVKSANQGNEIKNA